MANDEYDVSVFAFLISGPPVSLSNILQFLFKGNNRSPLSWAKPCCLQLLPHCLQGYRN